MLVKFHISKQGFSIYLWLSKHFPTTDQSTIAGATSFNVMIVGMIYKLYVTTLLVIFRFRVNSYTFINSLFTKTGFTLGTGNATFITLVNLGLKEFEELTPPPILQVSGSFFLDISNVVWQYCRWKVEVVFWVTTRTQLLTAKVHKSTDVSENAAK